MVYSSDINSITSSTTLSEFDDVYLLDASGGAFTITLPTITSDGTRFRLIRIDSDTDIVTIEGSAPAETIDEEVSVTLPPRGVINLESYGIDDGTGGVWVSSNRPFNKNSIFPLSLSFNRGTGNGNSIGNCQTATTTPVIMTSFIYGGTDVDRIPTEIKAVIGLDGGGGVGTVELYNSGPSGSIGVIAQATTAPTGRTILTLTPPGGAVAWPPGETVIDVRISRTSGGNGTDITIYSLRIL
jgi:hypothetical protein